MAINNVYQIKVKVRKIVFLYISLLKLLKLANSKYRVSKLSGKFSSSCNEISYMVNHWFFLSKDWDWDLLTKIQDHLQDLLWSPLSSSLGYFYFQSKTDFEVPVQTISL